MFDKLKSIFHSNTKDNIYIDFEILNPDGEVVNAFSMSQSEIDRNFERNLIKNIAEVMYFSRSNINIISSSIQTSEIEIYGIIFTVNQIPEIDIQREKDYNSDDYIDYNPYFENSWSGMDWYCIRCGYKLLKIFQDDQNWGYLWETMGQEGTLYWLCSNSDCCHFEAPLVLHHPIKGYTSPAGDSYGISWVK